MWHSEIIEKKKEEKTPNPQPWKIVLAPPPFPGKPSCSYRLSQALSHIGNNPDADPSRLLLCLSFFTFPKNFTIPSVPQFGVGSLWFALKPAPGVHIFAFRIGVSVYTGRRAGSLIDRRTPYEM